MIQGGLREHVQHLRQRRPKVGLGEDSQPKTRGLVISWLHVPARNSIVERFIPSATGMEAWVVSAICASGVDPQSPQSCPDAKSGVDGRV